MSKTGRKIKQRTKRGSTANYELTRVTFFREKSLRPRGAVGEHGPQGIHFHRVDRLRRGDTRWNGEKSSKGKGKEEQTHQS